MSRQMQYILRLGVKSEPMEKPSDKFIGSRIKMARKEAGLTQVELGEKIGRTQGIINKMEAGEIGATLENLYNLADVLNHPVTFFLGLEVGDLDKDEAEVVDVYRSLPENAKQYGKTLLRSWADQVLGRVVE
jgi:transcriptional regulator with XRE-family HTH domain